MDVSGNQKDGNYKFMGIVIGTQENLDSTVKRLKLDRLSAMSTKTTETRKALASQLKFNNRENIAFCILIERDQIIKKMRKKKPMMRNAVVLRSYNHSLFKFINDRIIEFARKHNIELSDIVFECDEDCKWFAIDNGLQHIDKKYVHMLSDLVAWSNNKGVEPFGTIQLDFTRFMEKNTHIISK